MKGGVSCPLGEAGAENRNCRAQPSFFRRDVAQEVLTMRIAALALMGALGLAVSAVSASAAPAAPSMDTPQAANIIQIAAGLGPGFHPNLWGRRVPHSYAGYYF